MAIVPACGLTDAHTARLLRALLQNGTNLLLESGAGFHGPTELAVHQRLLHTYFGIAVDRRVETRAKVEVGGTLRKF